MISVSKKISQLTCQSRNFKSESEFVSYLPKIQRSSFNVNGRLSDARGSTIWCRHWAMHLYMEGISTQLKTRTPQDISKDFNCRNLEMELISPKLSIAYYDKASIGNLIYSLASRSNGVFKALVFSVNHCMLINVSIKNECAKVLFYDPNKTGSYNKALINIDHSKSINIFKCFESINKYYECVGSGFIKFERIGEIWRDTTFSNLPVEDGFAWSLRHNRVQDIEKTKLPILSSKKLKPLMEFFSISAMKDIVTNKTMNEIASLYADELLAKPVVLHVINGSNSLMGIKKLEELVGIFGASPQLLYLLSQSVRYEDLIDFECMTKKIINSSLFSPTDALTLFDLILRSTGGTTEIMPSQIVSTLENCFLRAMSSCNTKTISMLVEKLDNSHLDHHNKESILWCDKKTGVPAFVTLLYFNKTDQAHVFASKVAKSDTLRAIRPKILFQESDSQHALEKIKQASVPLYQKVIEFVRAAQYSY